MLYTDNHLNIYVMLSMPMTGCSFHQHCGNSQNLQVSQDVVEVEGKEEVHSK